MKPVQRDLSLDTLLDLHGIRYFLGDKGHSVRFDVRIADVTTERPHGLRYALTVHDPNGARLGGFDNAHPVKRADGPGGGSGMSTIINTGFARCAPMTTSTRQR